MIFIVKDEHDERRDTVSGMADDSVYKECRMCIFCYQCYFAGTVKMVNGICGLSVFMTPCYFHICILLEIKKYINCTSTNSNTTWF